MATPLGTVELDLRPYLSSSSSTQRDLQERST